MYVDHSIASALAATLPGSVLSTVFVCALLLGAAVLFNQVKDTQ